MVNHHADPNLFLFVFCVDIIAISKHLKVLEKGSSLNEGKAISRPLANEYSKPGPPPV